MPAGPAILAGIGFAGQIASSLYGNRARGKEAQKDRDFQERMRNTEWQAGIADMEKAGVNPALAYGQGGASSPSGSLAQQSNVGEDAVGTAMAVYRQKKELKLLEATTAKAVSESHEAQSSSTIRQVEEREAVARRGMYFDQSGKPNDLMRQLMMARHSGQLGTSAMQVNNALTSKFALSEQEMMSRLFESMKEGGAGAKTFAPLLIALMAGARRGR